MFRSPIIRYALFAAWMAIVSVLLFFVFFTMTRKAVKNVTNLRQTLSVDKTLDKAVVTSEDAIPRFGQRGVKIQYATTTMNLNVYYPANMELETRLNTFLITSLERSSQQITISRSSLGQVANVYDYILMLQKEAGKRLSVKTTFTDAQGSLGCEVTYVDSRGVRHWSDYRADGEGAIYIFETSAQSLLEDLHAISHSAQIIQTTNNN